MTIAQQTPGKQWVVASETRANTLYVVKRVDGGFSCDCDGHYHRGHCKHVAAVAAMQPALPADPIKLEAARALGILAPKRAA